MNKQIEEIASILCKQHNNGKCVVYGKCEDNCSFREDYKRLYNAGYRKSTGVAREIFAELDDIPKHQPSYVLYTLLTKKIAELKKKYESANTFCDQDCTLCPLGKQSLVKNYESEGEE